MVLKEIRDQTPSINRGCFEQTTNIQTMEIRSYNKQELAVLYFPDAAPRVAMKRLRRWISHCPELVAGLKASSDTGKCAKYWSRPQVELIVRYLDEP